MFFVIVLLRLYWNQSQLDKGVFLSNYFLLMSLTIWVMVTLFIFPLSFLRCDSKFVPVLIATIFSFCLLVVVSIDNDSYCDWVSMKFSGMSASGMLSFGTYSCLLKNCRWNEGVGLVMQGYEWTENHSSLYGLWEVLLSLSICMRIRSWRRVFLIFILISEQLLLWNSYYFEILMCSFWQYSKLFFDYFKYWHIFFFSLQLCPQIVLVLKDSGFQSWDRKVNEYSHLVEKVTCYRKRANHFT